MKCEACGQDVKKDRSAPDHRRLFGLIKAAFMHWPEGHEFEPADAEHLRFWLLCKAGFCERTPITFELVDNPRSAKLLAFACETVMRASQGRGFVKVHGDIVIIFTPKSIAWDKLDQKAFNDIRDRVTAEIEAALRMSADDLLKHHEAAA